MKKIYLLACAIMSVVGASAQLKHNPNAFGRQSSRGESANTQQQYELPADRVTIYSNDFSNCSDWTIQNAFDEGYTDFITGIDFECSTDGPSGPAAIDPIASTSAANGFMMVDSDVFGGSTGGTWVENCWFQSAQPINLSAYDNVSLKFQSFYRMWDNGSSDGSEYCLVELSTDGVTWPDVTTYEVSEAAPGTRFELWPTMETQDPVNNPSTFVFNITDYAAQQDSIYLRFRWKGTWGYAWMVDDIEIFETFANDLNVNKVYNGDIINDYEYTAIPTSQMSDLVVGAIVANYGFNDQNAIATNMSISGTNGDITYTYLAGTIDTIWSTPINIGNTVGTYTATVTVPSDDENTFNTLSKDFKITQDWYSHCSDAPTAQRGWDIDDPIAVGATFTMNADAQAGGIQVWLGPNTTTDVVCQAVLYLVGADIQDLEVVGYSNEFNVPASMIDNDYVTVGFTGSGPVDVIAGAQYVVEILKTEENSDRLYVLADVLDEDFGTVNYGPFGTSDAVNHFVGYSWSPALRLVLDPNIAVAPVASNNASLVVNAYPNPTNGITTVKYASASNTIAQLTVRDITGRIVLTQQNPNLAQGQFSFDATTMAPGAYTYSVNAGTEVVTGELIVR